MRRQISDDGQHDPIEFDLTGCDVQRIKQHLPSRGGTMLQQHFDFTRAPAARRIETPAARNSDPNSSHLAAAEVTITGRRYDHQQIVTDAVHKHPGLTSAELTKYTGLERHEVARRLPDAAVAGTVIRGAERRCTSSGRMAVTWFPVERRNAQRAA
jgi:hypothetical protein